MPPPLPEPTLIPPTNDQGPLLPLVVVILLACVGFVISFVVVCLLCFSFKLIIKWIYHKHHWRAKRPSTTGSCCLADTNIPLSISNNANIVHVQANQSRTYVGQSEEALFKAHVPDNRQYPVTFADRNNRTSYSFYASLVGSSSSPSDTQRLQIEAMQLNPSYSSLDSQPDQRHSVLMQTNKCYAIGEATTETVLTDRVYASPKLDSPLSELSKSMHEYEYVGRY